MQNLFNRRCFSFFLFFISRIFQFLCHCDMSEDDIYWNSLMLDVTIKSKGLYEGLMPTSASTCEAFNALMTEPALSRRYNSYAPPPLCGPCIIRCRAKSPNWGICLLGTGRCSALQKAENLITHRRGASGGLSTQVGWSRLSLVINQIKKDC